MAVNYLTFRRFKYNEDANFLIEFLEKQRIKYVIEHTAPSLDISFSGAPLHSEIHIKIKDTEFETTEELLLKTNKVNLGDIPEGYYLLDFSDEELFEILIKPDEWNATDYQLSKQILQNRGKVVDDDIIKALRKQRLEDLAKPETSHRSWIIAGYLFAILGGFIGLALGWFLWRFKKTLPNGQRVYGHIKSDRLHGKIIMIISIIFISLLIIIKFDY